MRSATDICYPRACERAEAELLRAWLNIPANQVVINKFILYAIMYMYELEVNYHESTQLHRA
jgi:hypothetical protein